MEGLNKKVDLDENCRNHDSYSTGSRTIAIYDNDSDDFSLMELSKAIDQAYAFLDEK